MTKSRAPGCGEACRLLPEMSESCALVCDVACRLLPETSAPFAFDCVFALPCSISPSSDIGCPAALISADSEFLSFFLPVDSEDSFLSSALISQGIFAEMLYGSIPDTDDAAAGTSAAAACSAAFLASALAAASCFAFFLSSASAFFFALRSSLGVIAMISSSEESPDSADSVLTAFLFSVVCVGTVSACTGRIA